MVFEVYSGICSSFFCDFDIVFIAVCIKLFNCCKWLYLEGLCLHGDELYADTAQQDAAEEASQLKIRVESSFVKDN